MTARTGRETTQRAQSNVVGVALLIGLTMLSLGALTATVGTVLDDNAAVGDVERVANDLDDAVAPTETTGSHAGRVTFTDGALRTEERTVRVLRDGDLVVERSTTALVYDRGDYGVTAVAGAVVRDHAGSRSMAANPPVSVSESVIVVGVAAIEAGTIAIEGGPTTRTLDTEVSHDRVVESESGEWAVAVETPDPEPWDRSFTERGANVETREFAGDDQPSVVATFEGDRTAHVVVHHVDAEVRDG